MEKQNKRVVIILGAPGSGKGTQSELLAEKFNLYHLETKDIILKNLANIKKGDFVKVKGKKYFLAEERKLMHAGKIMSPPLIAFWIKNKVKELAKQDEGIVFNGSPRSVYEAGELIPLLKKLYGIRNIQVILINLTEKESLWRNVHRRTCELMRHTILYSKETAKLKKCPFDGSKLFLRKDDKPNIIKTRLKVYKERTFPVIEYFKKQKIKVNKINGSPPPYDVFKSVLKCFKK